MTKQDPFTLKRLARFTDDFRRQHARLATLKDLESAGFEKAVVERAVRDELVEELYVTLTTGAVQKGYKSKRS